MSLVPIARAHSPDWWQCSAKPCPVGRDKCWHNSRYPGLHVFAVHPGFVSAYHLGAAFSLLDRLKISVAIRSCWWSTFDAAVRHALREYADLKDCDP